MNLNLITNQVCNLSRAIGAFIKEELTKFDQNDIQVKGEHDFVTYVDKTAESRIMATVELRNVTLFAD